MKQPYIFEVGSTVKFKKFKDKYYIESASFEDGIVDYAVLGSLKLGTKGLGSAWHSKDELVYLSPATKMSLTDLQKAKEAEDAEDYED